MFQTTPKISDAEKEKWLLEPMVDLAGLLKEQTGWTWHHSGRVARYAVRFGKMVGLDRHTLMALQCAAMLHDVGNLSVPAHLLDKATKLTRDEWYAITKHSMASSLMLKARELPARVVAIAQAHHEWYNGTGYPLGLQGEAIPLGARVLSLADACDAMSSDRPYRAALPPDEIAREIEGNAGTQFDPYIVRELLPLICRPAEPPAPRVLSAISDDPMLYRQLWFAAYPLGWEIEAWPGAWSSSCPPDLLEPARPAAARTAPYLAVIDGRSLWRAPEEIRDTPPQPALWVDPIHDVGPAVYRPLDLEALLQHLDFDTHPEQQREAGVKPIRVLIADPYQLFRQALRRCLDERPEVEVVAEVGSPAEYRSAQSSVDFQVAIVASDLLEGTHSTAPLGGDDFRLADGSLHEAGTKAGEARLTIVLVTDEDLPGTGDRGYPQSSPTATAPRRLYIPRGAPAEALINAVIGIGGTPGE
jgi:HD domain